MKKTLITSTGIALLAILACSNEKDPQPTPKSRFDLLTAHHWRYISERDSTGKNVTVGCLADDTTIFLTTKYIKVLEGDSLCKDGEVIDRENKWDFYENETKIWFVQMDYTVTIIKLSEDSLVVKDDDYNTIVKYVK